MSRWAEATATVGARRAGRVVCVPPRDETKLAG